MGVVLFGTVRARGDVVDSVDVGEAGPRFAAAVSTEGGGFVRMWKRLEKFPATERRPAFELLSEAREVVVARAAGDGRRHDSVRAKRGTWGNGNLSPAPIHRRRPIPGGAGQTEVRIAGE